MPNVYQYSDTFLPGQPIIFMVEAESLEEADKALDKEFGLTNTLLDGIECEVYENEKLDAI